MKSTNGLPIHSCHYACSQNHEDLIITNFQLDKEESKEKNIGLIQLICYT